MALRGLHLDGTCAPAVTWQLRRNGTGKISQSEVSTLSGEPRHTTRHDHAATVGSGLMWANMLRAFQVGKARTSHVGPWSWMRESRVAWVQVSWPACHLTNDSASAVM